ncbi:arrestin domain-containing protein 15-like isoform X2 [Dysidea avara]|uniref:arrestin domain-containing protein 15-like isoform X2 n=1 Tax=Dysidea avara TaxID=196820 RepID=UPI00332AFFA5
MEYALEQTRASITKMKRYTAEFVYQYTTSEHTASSRESVSIHYGKRCSRRDIIQAEYKLIDYPGGFPVGAYSYPFQYTLPDNLPGVYFQQGPGQSWEACVKYFIKAELEVTGDTDPLTCEEPVVIYGHTTASEEATPEEYHSSDSVKTFCCIPRGDVNITAKLSKVAFTTGQKAFVHIEIANQSAVEIRSFVLKLIRVIKLYAKDNQRNEEHMREHVVIDTVAQSFHSGCKNNSSVNCGIPILLADITDTETLLFPPTTKGTSLSCHYVVDLDMHVPWAPAVEMHLPLIVKPSTNILWNNWTAPGWTKECKTAPVVDTCVVTPDIIASDVFHSLPGFESS